MKRVLMVVGLALSAVPLAACVNDGYGYGGVEYASRPYYGWYDDYYGPVHDGYWGSDGYFYYRQRDGDRMYRRDRDRHFRRDQTAPGDRYRRFEGQMNRPPRGTHMPRYPREERRDRD